MSEEDIYRKVTVRMWGDEKFRALTPMQPSGQALWLVLLTGEQTGIIPGLFKIGEAAFAEQLRWPLEGFREAFGEAFQQGMVEADWEARLVWVPNAIFHNRPASLNVIKSWKTPWSLLPECETKRKAWHALKAYVEGLGDAWAKAFAYACPEPSPKASPIQEAGSRKQKEEPKPKIQPAPSAPAAAAGTSSDPPPAEDDEKQTTPEQKACRRAIAEAFVAAYAERAGPAAKYNWTAADRAAVKIWANKFQNNAAKALEALREFITRMGANKFYAENFCPAFIGSTKTLNALALPVSTGPPGQPRRGAFVPLTGTSERFEGIEDDNPLGLHFKSKEASRG